MASPVCGQSEPHHGVSYPLLLNFVLSLFFLHQSIVAWNVSSLSCRNSVLVLLMPLYPYPSKISLFCLSFFPPFCSLISLSFLVPLLIHDSLVIPFTLHPPSPSFFYMWSAVLGTRPRCPQRPLWSTSHHQHVVHGHSSDSRASSSPWPPGPLRRPTTLLPPHRAWGSYTVAPGAAGGSGGAQDRGQGAAQPHPGHLATERAQGHGPAPTRAAGITWWGKYAPGAWMSNPSCEYMIWNLIFLFSIVSLLPTLPLHPVLPFNTQRC